MKTFAVIRDRIHRVTVDLDPESKFQHAINVTCMGKRKMFGWVYETDNGHYVRCEKCFTPEEGGGVRGEWS